jgi:4-oxalocrotonate tautomerase
MPYILIQVTNEGVTPEQKRRLIQGATDLVVDVLDKDPATTFVVIEEVNTDNWGVAGVSVTERRKAQKNLKGK